MQLDISATSNFVRLPHRVYMAGVFLFLTALVPVRGRGAGSNAAHQSITTILTTMLHCVVLDESTGDTLASRCSVTDKNLMPRYPPLGSCFYHHVGVGYFYSNGTFSVDVPVGPTVVRIGQGPEYESVVTTIDAPAGDTTVVLELTRVIDMGSHDWYSGDCQVHINHEGGYYTLDPEDAFLVGSAEDLNIIHCLDNDYYFTGGPDPCSTPDCIVYMSEEYRSSSYGHLCLLGLTSLVLPLSSIWWPLNMDIIDETHLQEGAIVTYAHPVTSEDFWQVDAWPGNGIARELPVDIIDGRVDAFEVMNYGNCHPCGIELELWYRLLNCGFNLPACAGTDACVNRLTSLPPGGYRTYVNIPEGGFTYHNWLEQLANGRSYVTNGPLITGFEIGGCAIGDSLPLTGGSWELTGTLSVLCAYPLDRAEIVRNGEVVRVIDFENGQCALDTSFTVRIYKSSWVAARVSGVDNYWHVIGDTLFAHTSPIYFPANGARIIEAEDAQYFVQWIDDLDSLAVQEGEWSNPDDSMRILSELATARGFYESLFDIASDAQYMITEASPAMPLLYQNVPNPFNAGTYIEFEIPLVYRDSGVSDIRGDEPLVAVEMTIYDVQGRIVRRLFDESVSPGRFTLFWDGTNDSGSSAASGVYLCALRTGGRVYSKKMLLVR